MLALGERLGSSGRDILTAMVCGYEVAGRISGPVSPDFRDRGHHGSAMAIFAAAVAAGKLLKLNVDQLTQTIALTATSASGLVKAADTSVAREYHAGLVTRAAIDAALAAQKGFIAEESVLEGPTGFLNVYRARRFRAWARPAAMTGTSSPTWRSSWCLAAIPTTRSVRPRPRPRAREISPPPRSKASPCHAPA